MPSRVSLELSRKMLPCQPYSITLSGQITFDYASHIIIAKDSASIMLAARAEETHTHTPRSMALRCRFSFLSRFNVGGKLWWCCIGPYRPWLSVIRHFGDSFPAPPPIYPLFLSLRPRPRPESQKRGQAQVHCEKTFHYNNRKKKRRRDGKPAKYKLCDAFSCWIYPRTCAPVHLLSKDSPISDTGYMHF